MKCLLDFVVCCRGTNTRGSKPPALEETRRLVLSLTPVSRPTRDRRPRNSVTEWRPSLSSIYEDGFSPERNRRPIDEPKKMCRKKSSFAAGGGAVPRAPARYDSDSFRKFDRPLIIPPFAPTFWF